MKLLHFIIEIRVLRRPNTVRLPLGLVQLGGEGPAQFLLDAQLRTVVPRVGGVARRATDLTDVAAEHGADEPVGHRAAEAVAGEGGERLAVVATELALAGRGGSASAEAV